MSKLTTKTKVQLRWNDMDMLGHLYNGKYQSLYDIGLSDYIRDVMSIDYENSVQSGGLWPIKVSTTLNFYQQVHYNHVLEVETTLKSIGNKSLVFFQQLKADQEIMSDCSTTLVCFNLSTQKSELVTPQWRELLNK